ncbi:MAG: hypothetical protein IPK26_05945 [Planctomycetes bacterium]|nr:hypothetical protein [Planctomycetota bacterium]
MTRNDVRLLWLSFLGVAVSGVTLGWMRWWCLPPDEFALVNHPWQPSVHSLHVALGPLAIFVLGIVWSSHARPRLCAGSRPGRRSGVLLLALSMLLVLTGTAVQVIDAERLREWSGPVHAMLGIGWFAVLLLHAVARVASPQPARPAEFRMGA